MQAPPPAHPPQSPGNPSCRPGTEKTKGFRLDPEALLFLGGAFGGAGLRA